MKKLLIICLVLVSFTRCKMFHTEGFNVYFWTSTAGQNVYLYIDGENKGLLPYLPAGPDCNNEELKKKTLKIHLPSATYDVAMKDSLQQTLYAEELTMRRTSGSLTLSNRSSYKHGGSKRIFDDACLIEELYYRDRP